MNNHVSYLFLLFKKGEGGNTDPLGQNWAQSTQIWPGQRTSCALTLSGQPSQESCHGILQHSNIHSWQSIRPTVPWVPAERETRAAKQHLCLPEHVPPAARGACQTQRLQEEIHWRKLFAKVSGFSPVKSIHRLSNLLSLIRLKEFEKAELLWTTAECQCLTLAHPSAPLSWVRCYSHVKSP